MIRGDLATMKSELPAYLKSASPEMIKEVANNPTSAFRQLLGMEEITKEDARLILHLAQREGKAEIVRSHLPIKR